MRELIIFICVIVLIACFRKIYKNYKMKKRIEELERNYQKDIPQELKDKLDAEKEVHKNTFDADDVSMYYKIRYIFSPNEFYAFKEIKEIADKYNLLVFPKMRLADICGVHKGTKNWNICFSRIKSKHIDFILCDDKNYSPTIAIELDDKTHDREDRKKRDEFVDSLMNHIGIPILHIYNTQNLEEKIRILLNKDTDDTAFIKQIENPLDT